MNVLAQRTWDQKCENFPLRSNCFLNSLNNMVAFVCVGFKRYVSFCLAFWWRDRRKNQSSLAIGLGERRLCDWVLFGRQWCHGPGILLLGRIGASLRLHRCLFLRWQMVHSISSYIFPCKQVTVFFSFLWHWDSKGGPSSCHLCVL